uniref:Thymidylate synthase n=1 Tax=viral metagenome TaxID=1070528 RepID=A0A6C0BCD6_9ZZZZ
MENRKVKLVSYTTFVNDNNSNINNIEDIVCYCARVSNPLSQINMQNNERLINYLMRNGHWSPFEMVNICLEINTTRDIARQILRHRSFSFQEFSQRYAVADLKFVIRETRLQDSKNRQNSLENKDEEKNKIWLKLQEDVADITRDAYNKAISLGIAKEVARAVLPEGMTPSRLYMNGSLRSWFHYIIARTHISTQKEHREIALQCANELENIFPMIKQFVYGTEEFEKNEKMLNDDESSKNYLSKKDD